MDNAVVLKNYKLCVWFGLKHRSCSLSEAQEFANWYVAKYQDKRLDTLHWVWWRYQYDQVGHAGSLRRHLSERDEFDESILRSTTDDPLEMLIAVEDLADRLREDPSATTFEQPKPPRIRTCWKKNPPPDKAISPEAEAAVRALRLSDFETEMYLAHLKGRSLRTIGAEFGVSAPTVRKYLLAVRSRLGL